MNFVDSMETFAVHPWPFPLHHEICCEGSSRRNLAYPAVMIPPAEVSIEFMRKEGFI